MESFGIGGTGTKNGEHGTENEGKFEPMKRLPATVTFSFQRYLLLQVVTVSREMAKLSTTTPTPPPVVFFLLMLLFFHGSPGNIPLYRSVLVSTSNEKLLL